MGFFLAQQGIFRRQLFAADGFFLGEKIIVDGKAELIELVEELVQFLDFVKLLIFLQAVAPSWGDPLPDGIGVLRFDEDVLVAEILIAFGRGVEERILAVNDHVEKRQPAVAVAAGEEFGEIDAAALDDFDQLFELAEEIDDFSQFIAGDAGAVPFLRRRG